MQRKNISAPGALYAHKPGSFTLVMHIIRGAYSNGMQLPAFLCIGLAVYLYVEKLPYHSGISALLICSLLLTGFLRGCASWQQDLDDYRRELAMQHHRARQAEADQGQTIPGFIPFSHR